MRGFVGVETLGDGARSTGEWVLLVLGLAASVTAIAYVTVLARRALDEMDADEPPHPS